MADTVQHFLESMVPELRQLRKRGVFSEEEVRMIVRQRRTYEYALKSKRVQLQDYIRYIEYEEQLEKLRAARLKRLGVQKKSEIARYSGVKYIHQLYIRALKHYHHHVALWKLHINFCLSMGSNKSLNKTFSRVLQLHPLEVDFWIQAAKWEYAHNHNILAARALMQRALRTIPKNKELWMFYCKLELSYWKKIKDRLALSGLDAASLIPKTKRAIDLEPDQNQPEENLANESVAGDPAMEAESAEQTQNNPFIEGAIPKMVYSQAVSQFPDDFEFAIGFYQLFASFPDSQSLQQHVVDSLEKDFKQNETCRALLASRFVLNIDEYKGSKTQKSQVEAAVSALEEAISDMPTPAMYLEYSRFYSDLLHRVSTEALARDIYAKQESVYATADKRGIHSVELYKEWVNYLLKGNRWEDALNVLSSAIEKGPSSPEIDMMLLDNTSRLNSVKTDLSEDNEQNRELITSTYQSILRAESDDDSIFSLWSRILNYKAAYAQSVDDLMDAYLALRYSKLKIELVQILATDLLEKSCIGWGIVGARSLYQRAFELPPVSYEFYRAAIRIEQSQWAPDTEQIRSLFEKAVTDSHGRTEPGLWLDYIKFEVQSKQFQKVSSLRWRAQKTLTDSDVFLDTLTAMNLS